jgi:acetylornithine deacetylase/succinyl-diaminopimelate desuccinylase-like protein
VELNDRVLKHIDSKEKDVVSFMQKIIQIPSVTGKEAEIGSFMAKECRKDELEVEIIEPKEGRVNIVANYMSNVDGPKVMMYSHYDVVPAGDLDSWKYPPIWR